MRWLGCTSCTETRINLDEEPVVAALRVRRKRSNHRERVLLGRCFQGFVKRGCRSDDNRWLPIGIRCEIYGGSVHDEPAVADVGLVAREGRVPVANALVASTAEMEG